MQTNSPAVITQHSVRYVVPNARHRYEIETNARGGYITVDANNRSQAARIAERHGYTVRSVNMVG